MVYEHKEKRFWFSGEICQGNIEINVFQCFPKNRLIGIGQIYLKKDQPIDFNFQNYNQSAFEAIKIIIKEANENKRFGVFPTRIIIKENAPECKKKFAQKYLKKMSYIITEGVRKDFYWI